MNRPPIGVPGSENLAAPAASSLWSTVNPAHAIQRASAILTFGEEVTSVVVNRIVDALRPSARAFGMMKEDPINSVLVQLGPGATPQSMPAAVEGMSFQQTHGPNVVQMLATTREAIRFDTFSYTRWVAFREQLSVFLHAAMPIVEQTVSMKSAGLEYVDFFYAKNEGAADVAPILDRKSDMLARHAFQRRTPFHSHCGWFEHETAVSRRLVNVDVTVNDATGPVGSRRAITVRTHEAEQITDARSSRARELVEAESILTTMDNMHISLKRRLAGVLTTDARALISLGN